MSSQSTKYGFNTANLEKDYKQLILSSSGLDYEIVKDIHNETGVLLVKSGQRINTSVYEKILNHKLLNSIDESLLLSDGVSGANLTGQLVTACTEIFGVIPQNFNTTMNAVTEIVAKVKYDRTVLNKMSVFKHQHDKKFDHSLVCAVLSVNFGLSLNYTDAQLADLFSAALLHDIGMMFLGSDVLEKKHLAPDDRDQLKVHPIVSYVLLKESKTKFSNQTLNAVLMHHERLDGSGYPRGVSGLELHPFARVLGVVDVLEAMTQKGYSMSDAIWSLKQGINEYDLQGEPVQAMYDNRVLDCLDDISGLEYAHTREIDIDNFADTISNIATKFSSAESLIIELMRELSELLVNESIENASRKARLKNLVNHLAGIQNNYIVSSGVVEFSQATAESTESEMVEIKRDLVRLVTEFRERIKHITSRYQQELELISESSNKKFGGLLAASNDMYDFIEGDSFKLNSFY